MGEANWRGWRLLWLDRESGPQGNIRKRPHRLRRNGSRPYGGNGEERAAPRRKRRLVNFWPVRPRRARRRPRLPRKGWVPPDIAEAGDRLRARPIRRTLHGPHTCARSRSGSRPSRCAQTVAVPLAELGQNQDKLLPNLQARHIRLRVARTCLVFFWGAGACVVLH